MRLSQNYSLPVSRKKMVIEFQYFPSYRLPGRYLIFVRSKPFDPAAYRAGSFHAYIFTRKHFGYCFGQVFAGYAGGITRIIINSAMVNKRKIFIKEKAFGSTLGVKCICHKGIFIKNIIPFISLFFCIILHVFKGIAILTGSFICI